MDGPWEDVAQAVQVSAYSLKALAVACRPLMGPGGSVVGMTFDATQAWPAYDWMGVAKAGLESTSRYLARDLGPDGIRCNLVSAGPLKTLAAKAIPGFEGLESMWKDRAPLGWDETDHVPTARAVCALLSDFFPATTGEIVHVDGGFHAMGA
jgi:enoyl-[acyl-carrier protein] reductase I